MSLSDRDLKACYDKSHLPYFPVSDALALKLAPALDYDWLTSPVPLLTIRGGSELDRTAGAAWLARGWLRARTQLFIPDDMRFYMTDAIAAMDRYKAALARKDTGYDDFDVLMNNCRYLTITEIGDLFDGDDLRFASLVRERRDTGKLTVMTCRADAALNERITETILAGRIITL